MTEDNRTRSKYGVEPFYTLPSIADQLGVSVSSIRRAVKEGLIPTYSVFSSRKRVRLSEVLAAIAAQQED